MNIPVVLMIVRSGWVARIILLLLAAFSLVTWAIIFNRYFYLNRMKSVNKQFRKFFDKLKSFNHIEKADAKIVDCPLGNLGKVGFSEYNRIITDAKTHTAVSDWSFYLQNQFTMASERVSAAAASISAKLDRGVFLLAIVGSIAPFLGLLGTVWGIMNSFYEIGNQGSASLPVDAPGIAEALITTIVGLAVAIPSVFFYNIFIHRTERIEDEMDEFNDNLLMLLKRELFNLLYGKKSTGRKAGQI
jgi:biopolymer transport protein TolQ